METAIIGEFTKHGILGAIILILMVVAVALWKAYAKSHEDRLTDSGKFQDRYVGLVEKSYKHQSDTNTVLEIIKEKVSKS